MHKIRIALLLIILTPCLFHAQPVIVRESVTEKAFRAGELKRYETMMKHQTSLVTTQPIDVTYYKLDIAIKASPAFLSGSVEIRSRATQSGVGSVSLDLMNSMTVDSVQCAGVHVSAVQHPSSFDVTLNRSYASGEEIDLKIFYRGTPGSSGFGSFEFTTHASTPWIWSLSEPYGAKDWWPCIDHPSDKADSADINVTCDAAYKVGANGKLMGVTNNGDGTVTFRWKERYPISSYLISVAITNYAQFSNWFKYTPTDSMEVLHYVLPEHLSAAQSSLPFTVGMLQIYSDLFGLYPFVQEKYGHSEFGWGGAMEHQTMTSTGSFGESIIAHELAHQWFGDMITCRTWPNIWLNEGFATYCEALYVEKKYGPAWYSSYIQGDMNSAKTAVGSVYVTDTSNVGYLFSSALVYSKGSSVLHMLRHVLGDTVFFLALRTYANHPTYKYGTAVTDDFRAVCESVSGKNLAYFFNEWIYGTQYPRYVFGWSSQPSGGGYRTTIALSQTSGTNPSFFTMPIDFRFGATGWDTTVTLFNDSLSQHFTVDLSHNPTSVQLDPNGWILKDFAKVFSAAPSSLTFGVVTVHQHRRDSITVSNASGTPLLIESVTSSYPDYVVTPSSVTIPGNGSQKFYVDFAPMSTGWKNGHLIFTHGGVPEQIPVYGLGFMPTSLMSVGVHWNLLSLPAQVDDPRRTVLFPTAISAAFPFDHDAGYVATDTLTPGRGYWMKFDSAETFTIPGIPIGADTILLNEGWNLIGAIAAPVAASAVVASRPDLLVSPFYRYGTSYEMADSLLPGRGYWVKSDSIGSIIVRASDLPKTVESPWRVPDTWSSLRITDASGCFQTLYLAAEESEVQCSVLPPAPPAGAFDVRFSSGRFADAPLSHDRTGHHLFITGARYPVTLAWEMKSALTSAALRMDGRTLVMNGLGTSRVAAAPASITLEADPGDRTPGVYALGQNYPNPFNPGTVIRYRLAERSLVTIEVFDLLGRGAGVLVNGEQERGSHEVAWNAASSSSSSQAGGVYFYRMRATSLERPGSAFTATGKMTLLR